MLKKGLCLLVLGMSLQANAGMECAGLTTDQSMVTVQISTSGVRAEPSQGQVQVLDREGNKYGYRIEAQEITQYFEQDLVKNAAAFVGVKAFILGDNPIDLFYSGVNYADQDLGLILKDPKRAPSKSGAFKVWRGPGYSSATQFDVVDFVCGVWADQ